MNAERKRTISLGGAVGLQLVKKEPDLYMCVLGSYLDNDTIFGRLIRWHQSGDASHSSIIFINKQTALPILEIHALEGWGVIATRPGVLGREGARVEMREVESAPTAQEALDVLIPRLGMKYEKPRGFITKSRREDPTRWFCSELVNDLFKLQNCPSCFVSPPWARRSMQATHRIGEVKVL